MDSRVKSERSLGGRDIRGISHVSLSIFFTWFGDDEMITHFSDSITTTGVSGWE